MNNIMCYRTSLLPVSVIHDLPVETSSSNADLELASFQLYEPASVLSLQSDWAAFVNLPKGCQWYVSVFAPREQ